VRGVRVCVRGSQRVARSGRNAALRHARSSVAAQRVARRFSRRRVAREPFHRVKEVAMNAQRAAAAVPFRSAACRPPPPG